MPDANPDPPPFEAFLSEHADAVLGYLRNRIGDGADDCFQETFIAALRAYPDFDGRNGRAWIIMIARNKAIDAHRSTARDQPLEPLVDDSAEALQAQSLAAASASIPTPGGNGVDPALSRLLAGLAEGQREAVLLRFAADLSFKQIGVALGCSEAAARRRAHDGLARLRERYQAKEHA